MLLMLTVILKKYDTYILWTPKTMKNRGFKPPIYGLEPLKMKVVGSHGYIYIYLHMYIYIIYIYQCIKETCFYMHYMPIQNILACTAAFV